jgi:hypothetical protein
MKQAPITRLGWHRFYAGRFNRLQREDSAHMALFYFLLHLAFDATPEMA